MIDTANKFLVAAQGGRLHIMQPPRGTLSREDAMLLAAWLVAMADPGGTEFKEYLDAVQNT